jgi:hypothetical protein
MNSTIYSPVEAYISQSVSHPISDSNSLLWMLQFETDNNVSSLESDFDDNALGDIFE